MPSTLLDLASFVFAWISVILGVFATGILLLWLLMRMATSALKRLGILYRATYFIAKRAQICRWMDEYADHFKDSDAKRWIDADKSANRPEGKS